MIMQTRETPTECPSTAITFATSRGEIQLRKPSGARGARVVEQLGPQGIAFLEGARTTDTLAGLVGLVSAVGADFVATLGALVGLGWCDPTHELETPYKRSTDLLEYGEAVWNELDAAGFTERDVYGMALVLLSRVYQAIDIDREAAEALDFTGVRPVSPS